MRCLGVSVLAVLLAGCMASGGGSPLQSLRNSSLIEVRTFSLRLGAHIASGVGVDQAINDVKQAIADGMKDPDSAKFRNVRIKPYHGGQIACGEVNSKNSYGAYVGYQRFAASHEDFVLEDADSKYHAINDAANAGLYEACVH